MTIGRSSSSDKAGIEFSRVEFRLPDGRSGDLRSVVRRRAGAADGAGRSLRRRASRPSSNLIPRFYERTGGVIAIDGQDVAAVSRRSLRSADRLCGPGCLSVPRHHPATNIAFGPAGRERGRDHGRRHGGRMRMISILGFPGRLRHGGGAERGLQLSGGERQRIAIRARRALVKNAPIILLDEATRRARFRNRSVMSRTRSPSCARARTTIVIAHRLATVMHADRILVIEGRPDRRERAPRGAAAQGRALWPRFCRLQLEQQGAAGRREDRHGAPLGEPAPSTND